MSTENHEQTDSYTKSYITGGDRTVVTEDPSLEARFKCLKEEFEQKLHQERANTLTIFSIFTAVIVYVTSQTQIFKEVSNFWILLGLSLFFLASIILFAFLISVFSHGDRYSINNVFQALPILIIVIALFFGVTFCYSKYDPANLKQKIKTENVKDKL